MSTETLMKYNSPAESFSEALPIGNGRIGAMIYGTPDNENIVINEDSVWSGGLRHRINPDAKEGFAEVRRLLAEGKVAEAEDTAFSKMQGVTPNMRRYMPLGELELELQLNGKAREYSRSLDIGSAVADASFTVNGVTYTKEYFVSAPDEVMVMRISASEPASVSLSCCIGGRDDYYDDNRPCGKNMILFNGGSGSKNGIFFAACLGASSKGGELSTVGSRICVKNADEVMIVLSVRTSFYSEMYEESAQVDTEMALQCDFEELYYRHVNDYRELFDRVELSLNDNSEEEDLALMNTDERIDRLKGDELDNTECERLIHDNKLIELYFNFGRYLMISCSRPGTQPANIQGLWNDQMSSPSGSRYELNINTEMSYWIAESCNLSECHLPLFDLMERICGNGRVTAKEMYGIHKGFVCHNTTDIWGDTVPQDECRTSSIWPMGGAWLALHIYEHYEYTLDKEFLEDKYHILKEAAEFYTEYLTDDGSGRLVTGPSVSPENEYIDENGVKASLCMGPAIDMQIITVLFADVINAAHILGRDSAFADKLRTMMQKLPLPQVGKYGQIMEWSKDYDESDIGHKHISQLFALHPADLINPYRTPKLADAARATLVRRLINGGGKKGWSCAWITNMWARLYDSRMVYENLKRLLSHSTNPNMTNSEHSFQLDANFGGTAAIAEALLQSCGGEIDLLPALPDEWKTGHVKGLKAKGGYTFDIYWVESKLTTAEIYSEADGEMHLRANCVASITCDGISVNSRIEDGVIIFNTEKGKTYTVKS
ncbi:MAG: glycoside hydrolase family 95 protein [Ruminococcus sp.]|uniref:glycoside hydrolase family 95 protein n=1 Tax=Ruminococcus sp. TaxID=41978 RepID=UPI0025DED4CB|nr:glycoside hydrolase family 95 protein [Ruminococcus sp.]MCR4794720.1 glycoside hydrolase family 95 protein [Ruminococcus sp.]